MRNLFPSFRCALVGICLMASHWSIPAADNQTTTSDARQYAVKPSDPFFDKFQFVPAPQPEGLILKAGDRLAICGDSITEQKMYSRIIETYLTVVVPEMQITVRQYGWSGETVPGFLGRMKNDCLRFKPTIATTCYGMNDHGYRAFEDNLGKRYRETSTAMVRMFKEAGARVVLGSPGCVGKKPSWVGDPNATIEDMNLSLCQFRNIDIEIAQAEKVALADVFWPMLTAGFEARKKYSPDFAIAGKDGVHPGWAGHLVMAYAFLHALGLDGNVGAFVVDWQAKQATTTAGHEMLSFQDGELRVKSHRYPFCAPAGDLSKDDNIRAGLALVPFNPELNRLTLKVINGTADRYEIAWGTETRTYSASQLASGINLAADFSKNPFNTAFAKVDAAVVAKQNYETRQVKDLFHGPEGKTDMAMTAALTEEVRTPLAEAIKAAFVPVTHTIKIRAL